VYLGARNRYVVRVGETDLKVLAPAESPFEAGDAVVLAIDPDRLERVAPGTVAGQ
jgi:hypothetical protein